MKFIKISSNNLVFTQTKNGIFPQINAFMNGKLAGELIYCLDFPNKGELNIEWIEVDEGSRRKGIGRSLINRVKELNPEYNIVGRTISDASTEMFKNMNLQDRRGI
jgi:GNAT superfamily N-acetyltransferase